MVSLSNGSTSGALSGTSTGVFAVFFLIQVIKPAFLYNDDGSLKQFGLGVRQKTVIPIWLITLILAIFSYLFVLYYLAMPKFRF